MVRTTLGLSAETFCFLADRGLQRTSSTSSSSSCTSAHCATRLVAIGTTIEGGADCVRRCCWEPMSGDAVPSTGV